MTTTKPLPSIGDTIVTPSGQTVVTADSSYKPLPESPGVDADFLALAISNVAYNDDGTRKDCHQLYREGHLDHIDLSGYALPERDG